MEKQNGRIGDAGTELLRFLHVRSTVWCRSALRAPWGFAVKARPVAAFHLCLAGACDLRVDGFAEAVALRAGDMAIVPNGRAHVARSAPGVKVLFLDDILAATPARDGKLVYGGDGPSTDLVCGGFELSDPAAQPLLDLLPPVLVLRGTNGAPNAAISGTLALLLHELRTRDIASDAIVTRLADALLAQALRAALRDAGVAPNGWRDREIAVAIAAIDEQPHRDWTLVELARLATMSRSAFAERFRNATGESPMRYLARARLARASALLRDSTAPVKEIALASGFGSEAAFSRAFRRHFGKAPRLYRTEGGATVAVRQVTGEA